MTKKRYLVNINKKKSDILNAMAKKFISGLNHFTFKFQYDEHLQSSKNNYKGCMLSTNCLKVALNISCHAFFVNK